MLSRVYKAALSHPAAVEIIRSGRGSAFDPEIADVFLEYEDQFGRIALEFADENIP